MTRVQTEDALVAVVGEQPTRGTLGERVGEVLVIVERHTICIQPVALHQVGRINEQQDFLLNPDRSIQLGDAFDAVPFRDTYCGH